MTKDQFSYGIAFAMLTAAATVGPRTVKRYIAIRDMKIKIRQINKLRV